MFKYLKSNIMEPIILRQTHRGCQQGHEILEQPETLLLSPSENKI